ncbi:unnamed protein product [Prunus armeniaca]|uniref:Uncharacterized protein n=1 Tax=Prunus armeniaca TaxID=36596 RepID=A0A6J5WED0_PRUAR|nr:unnamed protein product [Prunus armeniaca]
MTNTIFGATVTTQVMMTHSTGELFGSFRRHPRASINRRDDSSDPWVRNGLHELLSFRPGLPGQILFDGVETPIGWTCSKGGGFGILQGARMAAIAKFIVVTE